MHLFFRLFNTTGAIGSRLTERQELLEMKLAVGTSFERRALQLYRPRNLIPGMIKRRSCFGVHLR